MLDVVTKPEPQKPASETTVTLSNKNITQGVNTGQCRLAVHESVHLRDLQEGYQCHWCTIQKYGSIVTHQTSRCLSILCHCSFFQLPTFHQEVQQHSQAKQSTNLCGSTVKPWKNSIADTREDVTTLPVNKIIA